MEKLNTDAVEIDSRFSENDFFKNHGFRILLALRKISHAVDIYSKKLTKKYNITGPQLLCLYAVVENGPTTLTEISKTVSLSSSTLLGVVDRLEKKGYLERKRDSKDRRKVFITATEKGRIFSEHAPLLLHDKMAEGILQKSEHEQIEIVKSLEKVVSLMNMEDIHIPNQDLE